MSKYYAVKAGRNPGIYRSWDECKNEVNGYPGAVYKSFKTEEEAISFIEGEIKTNKTNEYSIYVDGSYDSVSKIFGWGIVIVGKSSLEEFKGFAKNSDHEYRNVAGEIYGTVNACKIAIERSYKSIDLYYDYTGIRHWALGEWKRNNPLTQRYYEFMQSALKVLSINFVKVKSHSGNKYNELADKLAKEGVEGGKND